MINLCKVALLSFMGYFDGKTVKICHANKSKSKFKLIVFSPQEGTITLLEHNSSNIKVTA